MKRAIAAVGLTGKAVMNGKYDLSLLNKEERVTLLGEIGQDVGKTETFFSLSSTAIQLRIISANIAALDKMSAPDNTIFPVVETEDLFVRQTYKDLYNTILGQFLRDDVQRPGIRNRIIVSGTSGIGKSAFLVYFAVRLLAESDDDNPPIIIFHTKRSDKCFVFGGRTAVRSGSLEDFEPFLSLPDTWYLADSSDQPALDRAKTIIAASPKTLEAETGYKDVDKKVGWLYYMAPWSREELQICWDRVANFQVVPLELVERLYLEIGGVPRYVLERPMSVCCA